MGYRNYLGIIKKENFKKIDLNTIESAKDNDGWCCIHHVLKQAGMQQIHELGKWSEEGRHLEDKKTKLSEELLPAFEIVSEFADNHEYGFNVLTEKDLLFVIRSYRMRTHKYLKKLLGFIPDKYDERTVEEKCRCYVREKLGWWKYSTNTKKESKFMIQDTWSYEYEMFNLLHNYKMIDWNEYLLVVWGW